MDAAAWLPARDRLVVAGLLLFSSRNLPDTPGCSHREKDGAATLCTRSVVIGPDCPPCAPRRQRHAGCCAGETSRALWLLVPGDRGAARPRTSSRCRVSRSRTGLCTPP